MRTRMLGQLLPRAGKALGGQNGYHGLKSDRVSRCRLLTWAPLRPGTTCSPTRQAPTCYRDSQCPLIDRRFTCRVRMATSHAKSSRRNPDSYGPCRNAVCPLWVKSRHVRCKKSALPLKADMYSALGDVC